MSAPLPALTRMDNLEFAPKVPDITLDIPFDIPSIDTLEELARIIRTMTYGELTTLSAEAGISAAKLYGWAMK